jgi:hypothetical protein
MFMQIGRNAKSIHVFCQFIEQKIIDKRGLIGEFSPAQSRIHEVWSGQSAFKGIDVANEVLLL